MSVYVKTNSGADLLTKNTNEFTLLYSFDVGSNSAVHSITYSKFEEYNMLFMEFSFNDTLTSVRISTFIDTSTIASNSYGVFMLTFPYNFDNDTYTAGIMAKQIRYERAAYSGSSEDTIVCDVTYVVNAGSKTLTEARDYVYPRYIYGVY